ncbi:sugar phosphate nucleotidyltransferase [Alphaproteobacteria bacterium]|nr:sugar phosphate nucleotidyltransferase [Alphaproteobacteria bacterium]
MSNLANDLDIISSSEKYKNQISDKKLLNKKELCSGIVLMAGGNGRRLAPLTNIRPKPLLKVGPRPIIDTTLKRFIDKGYSNFFISINHLGEMIEDYFKDGSKLGVKINYLKENAALGTAGSLSLLPFKPEKPIIVMNADILTNLDFNCLIDQHIKSNSFITVCVRQQSIQVPYGVIEEKELKLLNITEKPYYNVLINAGIYVLNPGVLKFIEPNTPFDMTDLIKLVNKKSMPVSINKINGYWCDIGQKHDLEKANNEFSKYFG